MKNLVIIIVLILVLTLSISYIIKAKKNGVKCIGCPSSKNCSGHCGCSCGSEDCNHEN